VKSFITISTLLLILSVTASSSVAESTYEATVSGMKCSQNSMGSLECTYNIGEDLEVNIVGVGDPDAGITIYKSKGIKGDYYPTFGLQHGCLIIKPGEKSGRIFDYAFISPEDGKIYKTWQECLKSK
jgi:hypothetical protein